MEHGASRATAFPYREPEPTPRGLESTHVFRILPHATKMTTMVWCRSYGRNRGIVSGIRGKRLGGIEPSKLFATGVPMRRPTNALQYPCTPRHRRILQSIRFSLRKPRRVKIYRGACMKNYDLIGDRYSQVYQFLGEESNGAQGAARKKLASLGSPAGRPRSCGQVIRGGDAPWFRPANG